MNGKSLSLARRRVAGPHPKAEADGLAYRLEGRYLLRRAPALVWEPGVTIASWVARCRVTSTYSSESSAAGRNGTDSW